MDKLVENNKNYYNVPRIRRLERNRLFLYKYLLNAESSFFYFFFQRVSLSDSLFLKFKDTFLIKKSLLQMLNKTNTNILNNLSSNNINVIFVKKNYLNFFNMFEVFLNNNNILFLGGIFRDNNKLIFIDRVRFLFFKMFFDKLKIFELEILSLQEKFKYNLIITLFNKIVLKKVKFINLLKKK